LQEYEDAWGEEDGQNEEGEEGEEGEEEVHSFLPHLFIYLQSIIILILNDILICRCTRRARGCRGRRVFGYVDQLLSRMYQKLKMPNLLCMWRSQSKWLLDLLVHS
jgi:hypothetical protein